MESMLQLLKQKYPVLQYFNAVQGVNPEDLAQFVTEIHLKAKEMSPQSRIVHKRLRGKAKECSQTLQTAGKGRGLHLANYYEQLIIDIDSEKIRSLEALERRHFQHLTELQFNNNEITQISSLPKLVAPSLEELDLSSNSIVELRPINNIHWKNLRKLLLSQNRIESVQSIRFKSFESLSVLNLSDNLIVQVRFLRRELNGLKNLREVDLSNNYILEFNRLSECQFVGVRQLNLQNNCYCSFVDIEKISLSQQWSASNYEIQISTPWVRDKLYIYGYRILSRHKMALKIDISKSRIKRQCIQKGRKLNLI